MTCIDLRPWAKEKRYRWRFEESYDRSVSDPEWYVEILCHNGLIYPKGGDILLAYAKSGARARIAALGDDIQHHQWDGNAEVFRFPVERLDEVAAILKPKRLSGQAQLTPEHREKLKRYAFQGGVKPSATEDKSMKLSEAGEGAIPGFVPT
jgi:hypothetical protein